MIEDLRHVTVSDVPFIVCIPDNKWDDILSNNYMVAIKCQCSCDTIKDYIYYTQKKEDLNPILKKDIIDILRKEYKPQCHHFYLDEIKTSKSGAEVLASFGS